LEELEGGRSLLDAGLDVALDDIAMVIGEVLCGRGVSSSQQ